MLFGVVRHGVAGPHYKDLTQLLLACDKLSVVGKSTEAPALSENTYHIYYPGDDLMAGLLERARRLGSQLSKQAAAQIVVACCELGYRPHEPAWRALLAGGIGDTAWLCFLCFL